MPRQTMIKCDKFINNPEEADLSDESDTSDIDSESDSALNPLRVPTGQLLFSIILKQGNNFFKDQG